MKCLIGSSPRKQIILLSASGALLLLAISSMVLPVEFGQVQYGLLLVTLLSTSLSLVLSFLAVRNTHRLLGSLAQVVEQFAGGDLDASIECIGDGDAGRLAEAFEGMRASLISSSLAMQEFIDELQARVKELTLLTDIDSAILAGKSLESILDLATAHVCELIGGDFCVVVLTDKKDNRVRVKSSFGFDKEENKQLLSWTRNKVISGDTYRLLESGETTVIRDLSNSSLSYETKETCESFGAKSMLMSPLIVEGRAIGGIFVWYKETQEFSETTMSRFEAFAGQVAVAIKSVTLVDGIRSLTIETLRALVKAIDARDSYTANHSDRVSRFAVALAQELGLIVEEVQTIEYAGLLHDIGKIGISEQILNKPGALTEEEMDIMKSHTIMSAEIINPIEFLDEIVPIVLHHHEWFNGNGYPSGLSGKDIPLGARILAVADALEAITSDRPYSEARSLLEGMDCLIRGSGVQFDPEMVKAIARVVKRIELIEKYDEYDVIDNNYDYDNPAADSRQPELEKAV